VRPKASWADLICRTHQTPLVTAKHRVVKLASALAMNRWLSRKRFWDNKLCYRRDSARCGCRSPRPKSI